MMPSSPQKPLKPLRGVRVLSLALNLPGPAALMRLKAMGATCTKAEPPGKDPVVQRRPHGGLQPGRLRRDARGRQGDHARPEDRKGPGALHRQLARTDVLLTSFRPSALDKLGLGWTPSAQPVPSAVHGRHRRRTRRARRRTRARPDLPGRSRPGRLAWICPPPCSRTWAARSWPARPRCRRCCTKRPQAKAAFRKSPCQRRPNGWRCLAPGASPGPRAPWAAPTQATRSTPAKTGGWPWPRSSPILRPPCVRPLVFRSTSMGTLFKPETHQAIAGFLAGKTRKQLDKLAASKDIPLHTLPN